VIKGVPEDRHVQAAWHAIQQIIEPQASHRAGVYI
jgi:hypothetical protein